MEKSLAMQRLEKDKEPILIGIIAGSPSDKAKLMEVVSTLKDDLKFFSFAATYASAHRTPERLRAVVNGYLSRGCRVFIALAGMAFHLAGAIAAETVMPVIAVPLASKNLQGLDALLAAVQMPPGIPAATMAIDGAKNSAIFAVQILATAGSTNLEAELKAHREKKADELELAAKELAINDYIPV